MPFVIIASLAAFIAGLTQSSLGFGMALILAPSIMLMIEPVAVVPTVLLMSLTNTSLVAVRSRHLIQWRLLLPLAVGGITGFTLGIRVLLLLDANAARLFVGLLVLVFTVVLWTGWRRPLPETPWTLIPVGFVSGFTGGATSIGGPPVALFLTNQNMPRDMFRANLVCYFCVISCYGIVRLTANGVLDASVALYALTLFPATVLGTVTGLVFGGRIPETMFRRAVFSLLFIMGVILVYNGART